MKPPGALRIYGCFGLIDTLLIVGGKSTSMVRYEKLGELISLTHSFPLGDWKAVTRSLSLGESLCLAQFIILGVCSKWFTDGVWMF